MANRKTFSRLISDISKLKTEFYKKKNLDRIAERARSIIYKRVKSGKGVNSDSLKTGEAEPSKLKPLSENYKKFRAGKQAFYTNKKTKNIFLTKNKKWIDKPVLGEFGSANRSNLTLSGQLLESMTYRVSSKEIYIFIPATKRKRINKFDSSNKTNKEVAEYVSKERPFLAITSGELRILEREVDLIIGEILRSLKL